MMCHSNPQVTNRYFLIVAVVALFLFSCKSNRIYTQVDKPPSFNGDASGIEFLKHAMSATIYPEEAIEANITGTVVVEFVVDVDGSVTDATVIRSVHPLLDAEALRVVHSSPKWTPGVHKRKPVKVKCLTPFSFRL